MQRSEELQQKIDQMKKEILVEHYFSFPGVYALFAAAGVGKTTLATQLSACIVSGKPFLNNNVRKGKVLYVSTEMNKEEYYYKYMDQTKASPLHALNQKDLNDLDFRFVPSKKKTDVENLIIKNSKEFDFFVIDMITYIREYGALSENRYDIGNFYQELNQLAVKNKIYILGLAHTLKDKKTYAGHETIAGAVTGLYVLSKKSDDEYELETVKLRYETNTNIFLKRDSSNNSFKQIETLELNLDDPLNILYSAISIYYDRQKDKIDLNDNLGYVWAKIELRKLCQNHLLNKDYSPRKIGRILSNKKNQHMLALQGLILEIKISHHQNVYYARFDNTNFNVPDEKSQEKNTT